LAFAVPLVGDDRRFLADPHVEIAAELNVGAAAGHVGGDGHRPGLAGLGDDVGFLLVVARVQHLMRDLVLLQERRQLLRFLDRDGAAEDRLLLLVRLLDRLQDRLVLLLPGAVDFVVLVGALDRDIGRHRDDVELVDVPELGRLGHRRAGHAGELGVHAEIVLEGDRGQRLVLVLDGDAFLRLERLVEALGIAPPFHHAAGELVDDDDLVVLDDVVDVLREELVGAQRLVDVVDEVDVADVVERAGLEESALAHHLLDLLDAAFGQGDGPLLLVLLVILGQQDRDHLVDGVILLGIVLGRPRDDERGARLVDEDRVDLVDDGIVERPLHHLLEPELHVVPEVVEAELVVGAVGDVGAIGRPPLIVVEPVHDAADSEAEGNGRSVPSTRCRGGRGSR